MLDIKEEKTFLDWGNEYVQEFIIKLNRATRLTLIKRKDADESIDHNTGQYIFCFQVAELRANQTYDIGKIKQRRETELEKKSYRSGRNRL